MQGFCVLTLVVTLDATFEKLWYPFEYHSWKMKTNARTQTCITNFKIPNGIYLNVTTLGVSYSKKRPGPPFNVFIVELFESLEASIEG